MIERMQISHAPHRPIKPQVANRSPTIRWSQMSSPLGPLFVAASERGVCAIEFGRRNPRFSTLLNTGARLERDARTVAPVMAQLREYFAGRRINFDLAVDLSSLTPFQSRVLAVTRRIPSGQVWTYRQVAQAMARPNSARPVGQALAHNPIPIIIPCHRVIASDGSLRGYSGGSGLKTKRWLLAHEGAPW
jgi:O-6-methylguanine DNA methyltransferase